MLQRMMSDSKFMIPGSQKWNTPTLISVKCFPGLVQCTNFVCIILETQGNGLVKKYSLSQKSSIGGTIQQKIW